MDYEYENVTVHRKGKEREMTKKLSSKVKSHVKDESYRAELYLEYER